MLYERPTVEPATFVDDDGADISYGRRWGMGHPPEDTYSVTRHPTRFAPLLDVSRALVAHVTKAYEVDVVASMEPMSVSRLTPRNPEAAPLVIIETAFPQVEMRAGAAGLERFPQCGCDACDEDLEEMAQTLERFVFAVIQGNFQEVLTRRDLNVTWSDGDGWRGSRTPRGALRRSDIDAMKAARRHKGARWQPWTLRA